jgi:N-acyl-D-glutamate deacylase
MQERGRIQEGMIADIVAFHPENFTENSTYQSGSLPSTRMTGTPHLEDGEFAKPGSDSN